MRRHVTIYVFGVLLRLLKLFFNFSKFLRGIEITYFPDEIWRFNQPDFFQYS